MAMNDLKSSKDKWDKINQKKKIPKKKKPKSERNDERKTFEEKHKRLTTYVKPRLYKEVKKLKKKGKIRTITEFVNEAFREKVEKVK